MVASLPGSGSDNNWPWVGARDANNDNNMYWVGSGVHLPDSSSLWEKTSWTEPNHGGSKNCVYLWKDNQKLGTYECDSYTSMFICEKYWDDVRHISYIFNKCIALLLKAFPYYESSTQIVNAAWNCMLLAMSHVYDGTTIIICLNHFRFSYFAHIFQLKWKI